MKPVVRKSLQQAADFLHIARLAAAEGKFNPAVSAAVHACIHAKDAICLQINGYSNSSKRHREALEELRATGKVPSVQLKQFSSVLAQKHDAEYESEMISHAVGIEAMKLAERFCGFVFAFFEYSSIDLARTSGGKEDDVRG